MSNEIELLEMLTAAGPEAWEGAIVSTPKLLSADVQEVFAAALAAGSPERAAAARPALDFLTQRRLHLEAHPEDYPLGGPIEQLFAAVKRGEISLETACEMARSPKVAGVVSILYLRVLQTITIAESEQDRWLSAVFLQALLIAASTSLPDVPEAPKLRKVIVVRGCMLVQRALVQAPDRFLFELARDAAQELLANDAYRESAGELHLRLGTLHLDPYTVGREGNYRMAIDVWARCSLPGRECDQLIPGIAARGMPEPADALRIASEHLSRAAELTDGANRGLSNKALAFALTFRQLLGEAIPTDSICALIDRASADLADVAYLRDRIAIGALRNTLGCPGAVAIDDSAALEGELARCVAPVAAEIAVLVARDVRRPAADRLRIVERVAARGSELAEQPRVLLASEELRLLFDIKLGPDTQPRDLEALQQALATFSKELDTLDPELAALRGYQLAFACDELEVESRIPDLLAPGHRVAPSFLASRTAFAIAEAQLLSDAAAVAFNGGAHAAAAELNLRATVAFDGAAMTTLAINSIEHAADAIEQDFLAGMRAFGILARLGPGLETRLGPPATAALQRMFASVLRHLDGPSLVPWLHALKGARLAVAMQSATLSPVDAPLLRTIDELEASLTDDTLRLIYSEDSGAHEEELLASRLDYELRREGTGDAVRLANLQARFDRELTARIVAAGEAAPTSYFRDDQQRRAVLDHRTVLVDLFWDEARASLYTVLSTRERTVAGRTDSREFLRRGQFGADIDLDPLGLRVHPIRQRVVLDSEMRPVDGRAAEGLSELYDLLFGVVAEDLRAFRAAGKDHLCLVPHRALHYAPLHLSGPEGHPLADDWIVTYLPNLSLLTPRPRPQARRDHTIAAYGVTFAGTAHALPEALTEVKSIAGVFNTAPFLDADAHRDAVIEGLTTARYVHVCSHGRHNVIAPSFQTLFCGGGTALRAYDVIGRDLRGLEVVTLAACETGLGRFDGADNLAGLPAAIFLGGAETLVGTLWKVESAIAEIFFTQFYEALRGGASRLDAFATAQRSTRDWSPKYRHWGGFFLSGAWT